MKKIRVAVLFGGRSVEHAVSLLSAKNILRALDPNKYEIIPIGIDKAGRWHLCTPQNYLIHPEDPKLIGLAQGVERVTVESQQLIGIQSNREIGPIDVVFPVLHGTFGEDGTIQGLLKLANIPFVGSGILGSAIGIDKEITKRLLREAGIRIASFLCLQDYERNQITYEKVVESLGSPVFVKPARAGSSIGLSKVKSKAEFEKALESAFQYDHKVLIEEEIKGREIECAVLGNENPLVSVPGEILHRCEFYTYEAKYIDAEGTICEIPAKLTPEQTAKIQSTSLEVYRALSCDGMARVDSFLTPENEVVVNEINTIPGFTHMSPFPRLWEASGLSYEELVDRLIQLALDLHEKEKRLKTHYTHFK